ncbi:MAG: bifunctional [glutamate--ammonia ligase]-adenylyl-L-tyrosine phosphorylase/[glutamate--ammonia-ligase] adenylyltransferase, partial [Gammaproteobacteria bacterium]|nr:bifunctional [glutamate--ammonia ligase]-adenylyl-L-tyrosine phosphorylase/[glutamate--ammonia-ligase] adenylyltransferase [Gammaproteobacteria bacterium]
MLNETAPYQQLPPLLAEAVANHWHSYQEVCTEKHVIPPSHSDFLPSLIRVWASSDFAVRICCLYPELLTELFVSGDILREYAIAEIPQRLQVLLETVSDEATLMTVLRRFRRREMLRITWRDLAGWADLAFTSQDLSALADACIQGSLQKLAAWEAMRHGMPVDSHGQAAELLVVALGKLGAEELNFSSDVDLMLVYPDDGEYVSGRSYQTFFTRLGQQLIKVLSLLTAEGFVFRVDMRLRPDGSSGALVVSCRQLQEYYITQGRDWERYALIKARVLTGNDTQRKRLEKIIKQFVYRHYVDFSMIEALRQLQQKISQEVRKSALENNVKRGPGGIREIEFIGQTFKLIRGGLLPKMQLRKTIGTALVLRDMGYFSDELANNLIAAYQFLRNVENRLQMQQDQQTHELPTAIHAQTQIAYAMRCTDWQEFTTQLHQHMRFVHQCFEELIAKPRMKFVDIAAQDKQKRMKKVWLADKLTEKQRLFLQEGGYQSPQKIEELLLHLRQSPNCQRLSASMRKRLDTIMPYILVLVAQTPNPDQVLNRLIDVLEAVLNFPAYLALLAEHPAAIAQLVRLSAASSWIVAQIARSPALLDELLRPEILYAPPGVNELQILLEQHLLSIPEDSLDEQVQSLQAFKQAHILRIAAADITGVLPLMKVSDYLTFLATAVVNKVLQLVWYNMTKRYGFPPGTTATDTGFLVIAYGKLGGLELSYSSDLDLVFVHQDMAADVMTNGAESITGEQFYTRMGQQLLTLLNGQTALARLYEIDMRLRPSGDSGLLVPSMSAFSDYQQHQAWLWEHQALVRARVVAGDQRLAVQFNTVREQVLGQVREQQNLQQAVREMRQKMRDAVKTHYPDQFDLKQGIGGITDIEFVVQYAVLYWSHQH